MGDRATGISRARRGARGPSSALIAAVLVCVLVVLPLTGCGGRAFDSPLAEADAAGPRTSARTPARLAGSRSASTGSRNAKNVILMIADGCGYNMVEAANAFAGRRQTYESFPVTAAMSTAPIGSGYDPSRAWSDPEYVKENMTDSGAAATAMATGRKTHVNVLGMAGYHAEDAEKVTNVVERAEALGKATGVVTTVPWCDATPAGFVVHQRDREDFQAVARDMVASTVDVMMGAGNPDFTDDSAPTSHGVYTRVGGKDTWDALVAGTAGGDADRDGRPDPWKLVQSREDFKRLMDGEPPKRVLGTFEAATAAQLWRSGDTEAAAFAVPFDPKTPTLAEMAIGAMNVVDGDPQGYFLMIEGGAVDDAEHTNRAGRAIEEEIAFDEAVQAVIDRLDAEGGWADTLLVVTADHETGLVTGTGAGGPDTRKAIVDNGKGRMPGMEFHSNEHTNHLVPLYADGASAGRLIRLAKGHDPVRGRYLDNAQLGGFLLGVLK